MVRWEEKGRGKGSVRKSERENGGRKPHCSTHTEREREERRVEGGKRAHNAVLTLAVRCPPL